MKLHVTILSLSILLTAVSTRANVVNSVRVAVDAAACLNDLERASDSAFECTVKFLESARVDGAIVHGEEHKLIYGSCRVALLPTETSYRLTLSKDSDKRQRMSRNEAIQCLRHAIDRGGLHGQVLEVMVTPTPSASTDSAN